MIELDCFAIRHRNRTFLRANRDTGGFELVPDVMDGGRWTEDNAQKLLPMLASFYVNPAHLEIVRAPACCCGAWRPAVLKVFEDKYGSKVARCEKHAGRLPCIITGCGRTFKMAVDDSYGSSICCGRHWRMAPRYLRDRVTKIRKRARRLDWPDRLSRLHHLAWNACIRAIEKKGEVGGEGHIDIAEIERMFGL